MKQGQLKKLPLQLIAWLCKEKRVVLGGIIYTVLAVLRQIHLIIKYYF